jgi:MFS family permease
MRRRAPGIGIGAGIAAGDRRLLVITVTAVMAVSTLMQYGLSALSPLLIDDLHLSKSVYGSLYTAYYLVCAIGSLLLGGVTQRMGPRWGMALVGVAAGAGFVVIAGLPSLASLYAGLALAGVASALANPATNAALMDVPDRGPLIGVKQSGVQVSPLVGGAVLVPFAQAVGWREAMLLCALVCLLLVAAAALVPLSGHGGPGTARAGHGGTSIGTLALFAFFMGFGLSNVIAYLPVYGLDLGLSHGAAGSLLVAFGVCAVAGRVGWGYVAARSRRLGRPATVLGLLVLGALAATALIAAAAAAPWLVFGGTALMGLTGAAWNGLVMTFVVDSAPSEHSGRAAGRVQAAFFAGLCASPLLSGVILDRTGAFGYVWAIIAVIYVAALIVVRARALPRPRDHSGTAAPQVKRS